MDVIDKINQLLAEKGITGAELSRAIGLSNAVYSQWNTKRTKPSTKTLKKVADFFGVPVGYLTGRVERNEDGMTFSDGSGFGGGSAVGSGFGDGSGYGGPIFDQKENPAAQEGSGIEGYAELNDENRQLIDQMIARLLAGQSRQ